MKETEQSSNDEMKEMLPEELKNQSGFMTSLLALIAVLTTIVGGIWLLSKAVDWIGGTF